MHFNGHTDVVEAGQGWSFDPFGAELADGRIYGRGTCDMKGGLAAAIVAVEAFLALRPELRARSRSRRPPTRRPEAGAGWRTWRGSAYFGRVDAVIIPEPLNKDRICLGHRGVWWAELETFGRIAHGSMPFLGDCAVRHMGAVLAEIEASLMPALAARRTAMPVVPEAARASTLNINSIHGGQAEPAAGFDGWPSPCVPDRCRMVIDRRFLHEEDIAQVKRELRDAVERARARRGFRYAIREMHEVLPVMVEREAPVAAALEAGVRRVLGRAPEYVASPGTYDQKHIDRIGRLRNCVAYGPGILDLAHQPDEYVGVEDMLDAATVMGLALADLLGGGGDMGELWMAARGARVRRSRRGAGDRRDDRHAARAAAPRPDRGRGGGDRRGRLRQRLRGADAVRAGRLDPARRWPRAGRSRRTGCPGPSPARGGHVSTTARR